MRSAGNPKGMRRAGGLGHGACDAFSVTASDAEPTARCRRGEGGRRNHTRLSEMSGVGISLTDDVTGLPAWGAAA